MLSLNTNELMIVIKARNEAAKVLKEVEDQLWLIVEAAQAANLAISQICAPGGATGVSDKGQGGPLAWLKDNAVGILNVVASMIPYLKVLKGRLGGLGPIAKNVVNMLTRLFSAKGLAGSAAGLKDTLAGAVSSLKGMGPALAPVTRWAGRALAGGALAGGALVGVKGAFAGVGSTLAALGGPPVWAVVAVLAALVAVGTLVWLNWDTIVASGKIMLDWFQQDMLPFFASLPEQLGGIFGEVATSVAGGVNDVITVVEGMANGVIDGINEIITAWNSLELTLGGAIAFPGTDREIRIDPITIRTPDRELIKKISIPRIPIPSASDTIAGVDIGIPTMAGGGIIRRPTLALVGESGPEAVIPLGRRFGGAAPVIQVINRGNIVTERQLEDVIVKAYHRAARLGRI